VTAADSLRVYYPGGGRFLLLHWWTYDERGHVILAPTERSLRDVSVRVFARHPDAEIKDYCEVEIVAPSARLCALAAESAQHARVANFHEEIVHRMGAVLKAGKELPPPFERCTNYEPEDPSEADGDQKEWEQSTHYDCRHCRHTIRLVGMTPVELYDRYSELWRQAYPLREHADPRRVLSRAVSASDDERIWCAVAAFGPHASGVSLNEVDMQDAVRCFPSSLSDSALFFFRRRRVLDSTAMTTALEAAMAEHKARREQRERDERAEYERKVRQEIENTLWFFGAR